MANESAKMHLASFMFGPGGHMGAWRLPDAICEVDMEIEHYVELAKICERGKMDALFFQDILAVPRSNDLARGDTYGSISRWATYLDPMTLLPALAMATDRIGLAATATATYNEPFHIARKLASIDHISGGRAGWNLVTSQNENEAQNFGFDQHVDHALRYERAGEFVDVVTGLWDSWDEGAIIRDKENGTYFDVNKLHILGHEGRFFKVRGPLNIDRAPQGWPVIFQAGASDPGRDLAARTADVVFTAQLSIASGKAFRDDVRSRTLKFGRSPDDVKILPGLKTVIGRTEEEAREKLAQMDALIPMDQALTQLMQNAGGIDLRQYPLDGPMPDLPETNSAKGRQAIIMKHVRENNLTLGEAARWFAGNAGHLSMVGTPVQIADEMEAWLKGGACDGFVVTWSHFPNPVTDFVDLVIPELQRRGIFRTEYEGKTLRENLGLKQRTRNVGVAAE